MKESIDSMDTIAMATCQQWYSGFKLARNEGANVATVLIANRGRAYCKETKAKNETMNSPSLTVRKN